MGGSLVRLFPNNVGRSIQSSIPDTLPPPFGPPSVQSLPTYTHARTGGRPAEVLKEHCCPLSLPFLPVCARVVWGVRASVGMHDGCIHVCVGGSRLGDRRGASSCVIVGMNGRPTTHHQRPPAQANQPMHSHGSRAWLGRRRPACERLKRERRTGPLQATCKKQALALRRASPSARRAVIVSLPLLIYPSIFSFTSTNFDTPHTAP